MSLSLCIYIYIHIHHLSLYIYIYIFICMPRSPYTITDVEASPYMPGRPVSQPTTEELASGKTTTPFTVAFAIQSCSRNCSPAPDLVLWKLVFPSVFFSGGVLFSQTLVCSLAPGGSLEDTTAKLR